jgi:hypothetical protein
LEPEADVVYGQSHSTNQIRGAAPDVTITGPRLQSLPCFAAFPSEEERSGAETSKAAASESRGKGPEKVRSIHSFLVENGGAR